MQQPKIPVSVIHEVECAVEQAPACDETEVAKVEAMRRLVPAIKTMQAKGYGLAHIAKLFSDKGIAVTEKTLRQYVHRIAAKTVAASSRARRHDRSATGAPSRQAETRQQVRDRLSTDSAATLRPPGAAAATSPAASRFDAASAPSPAARSAQASSATDPGARRPGFHVRPDTKDI
jgi:hypothetical protein